MGDTRRSASLAGRIARARVDLALAPEGNRKALELAGEEAIQFLRDVMQHGEASEQRGAAMALLSAWVKMDARPVPEGQEEPPAEMTPEERERRLEAAMQEPEVVNWMKSKGWVQP